MTIPQQAPLDGDPDPEWFEAWLRWHAQRIHPDKRDAWYANIEEIIERAEKMSPEEVDTAIVRKP